MPEVIVGGLKIWASEKVAVIQDHYGNILYTIEHFSAPGRWEENWSAFDTEVVVTQVLWPWNGYHIAAADGLERFVDHWGNVRIGDQSKHFGPILDLAFQAGMEPVDPPYWEDEQK